MPARNTGGEPIYSTIGNLPGIGKQNIGNFGPIRAVIPAAKGAATRMCSNCLIF